jgi:hypothetical protein
VRKLLLGAALGLSGACHDSDGSDAVSADALVTGLIQDHTTETGAPVEVNGLDLVFPDDDAAFDDVLPLDNGPVVEQ